MDKKDKKGALAIISLTESGRAVAQKIKPQLENASIYVSNNYQKTEHERYLPRESFSLSLQQLFNEYEALICIMATGIVVRSLAPVLDDKQSDPAVLVMDEKGQFVISLLSGHLGGANQLAMEVAEFTGGRAVITTATDTQDVTALDLMAKAINGSYSDFKKNTKLFNTLLANHRQVGLFQDGQWVTDYRGLKIVENLQEITDLDGLIIVSAYQHEVPSTIPVVQIIPKCFVLGMGSRKEVAIDTVYEAFKRFCELYQIEPKSIRKLVSIELKKEEKGLIALAARLGCPFETFSTETLTEAASFYPSSEFVKKHVGIGNVASASAHYETNGQVLTERFSYAGVTIVLAASGKSSLIPITKMANERTPPKNDGST